MRRMFIIALLTASCSCAPAAPTEGLAPSPSSNDDACGGSGGVGESVASSATGVTSEVSSVGGGGSGGQGAGTQLPLSADFSSVPNAPGANGSYTSTYTTFTSSIDPALTNLVSTVTYSEGVAAAAIAAGHKLPVILFLHGYQQDMGYISNALRFRTSDHGFVAVAPNFRGRAGDSGSADDSARELQDGLDAIQSAVVAYPGVVDTSRVHIIGYSGGGAQAVAYVTKYPGRWSTVVSCFGWADYGVSDVPGHSIWAAGGYEALVESRIGPRTDLQPYFARLSLTNLAQSVRQTPTQLFAFWDEQDIIGIALRDVRDALDLGLAPASRWFADESTAAGDPTKRWLHGYPDQSPNLQQLENLVYRRVDEPAPVTSITAGDYTVAGYVEHAAGFEVWTGDPGSANPKSDANGGTRHVVQVSFDLPSRHFSVSPHSGPASVRISMGGSVVTQDVLADGTTFVLP